MLVKPYRWSSEPVTNQSVYLQYEKTQYYNITNPVSSSGASLLSQRRTRNASDWQRKARDHEMEKNERQYFYSPPSFACKFSSKETSGGSYKSCSISVGGGNLEQLSQLSAKWSLVGNGGDQILCQFKLSLALFRMKIWTLKKLYNNKTKQRPPTRSVGRHLFNSRS